MPRCEYEELIAERKERYDVILYEYERSDFVEITGKIGGDVEIMRIYRNGMVTIK